MEQARKAFMRNKDYRNRPGFHFGGNDYFIDRFGKELPIQGRSYSMSISKVNDEPAQVHVETAKTTPQGIIRRKKNFEVGGLHNKRAKWLGKHFPIPHVKFNIDDMLGIPESVKHDQIDEEEEDYYDEEEDESPENEEEEESLDKEEEEEISEEKTEKAVDIFTRKLKKAGFSDEKIHLVKKMLFDIL